MVKRGSQHDRVICNLDNGAMERKKATQRESKLRLGWKSEKLKRKRTWQLIITLFEVSR